LTAAGGFYRLPKIETSSSDHSAAFSVTKTCARAKPRFGTIIEVARALGARFTAHAV
jgi:hypothetical protein